MNPQTQSNNDAAVIADLTVKSLGMQRQPFTDLSGPIPRLMLPGPASEWKERELCETMEAPLRLSGFVAMQNVASFLNYVKLYGRDAAIFADENNRQWTAVFDHPTPAMPKWAKFRVGLQFPLDPRFTRWQERNGKLLPQMEFADFLEDNQGCIKSPNASELIDLVCDLRVDKKVDAQSSGSLRNGNIRLAWMESSQESREVPGKFSLQIPVFRTSSTAYDVTCRLRYRFDQGGLKWLYTIDQLPEMLRRAWQKECEALAEFEEASGVPVFMAEALQIHPY